MFPSEIPSMTTDALGSEICSLGAHIAAATCRWLLLIAEFDRRSGAGDWECRSTAHWLNWRCGVSLHTASHVDKVTRAFRRSVALNDESTEARHEGRYARWCHDDDGSIVMQVRLAPEDAEV